MQLEMFSIYDVKSKIYHPPVYCHNKGHALRMFEHEFSKPGTLMHQFPADFQVFQVGTWDDAIASLTGMQNPTLICNLADLLEDCHAEGNN